MNDFFDVISTASMVDGFNQTVRIDKIHKIFEGHFPGQPVLPGVCSLEIIKQGMETFSGKKLQFYKIKECKFLHAIDPRSNEDITFVCSLKETEEGTEVRCTLHSGKILALKLKALMIVKA